MLTPPAPQAWQTADRVLAALEHCEPRDTLTGIGWAVVGVLGALRERFEKTPEEREAFGRLCSETQPGSGGRLRPSGSRRRIEKRRSGNYWKGRCVC
jgi:hypothetical protein